MRTFKDQLALGLKLSWTPAGGGKSASKSIAGGDIKSLELHLANWGWSGTIEFDIFDDDKETDSLLPSYFESQLLKVELQIADYLSDKREEPDPPLTLKGLVTKRALREFPVAELPMNKQITTRRYRLEVADAAQVLWRQHHPCQLYADKTMKEIIEDQKSELIQLAGNWGWASRAPYKTPMVFFALDPSIGKASFYDFVMWYVDRHRLIWSYDCRTDQYSIEETKSDAGAAITVDWADFMAPLEESTVGRSQQARYAGDFYEFYQRGYTVDAPEVPRYRGEVLDSFTGATIGPLEIPNRYAEGKMVRQTLLRTPLGSEAQQRADLEQARLVVKPDPELSLYFSRMPIHPLFPGDVAEFKAHRPGWSSDAWPVQQRLFRVYDVVLHARAVDPTAGAWHRQPHAQYELAYTARLELKRDATTPRLPAFVEPTYPVYVEAKILSAIDPGDDQSLTYDPRTQPTNLMTYRVEVPLWKASAPEITAPYNPGRLPGQLFFPAYKHERVVLALTWRKAWIDSFVNWRDGVRIPSDMQGNHLLLGKRPSSHTSIKNYYENQSSVRPTFEIMRIHDIDVQKVVISEGNLLIEVNEDSAPSTAKVENVSESQQD